jgi:glycosyltransferase involved in cell wall biosynthesis
LNEWSVDPGARRHEFVLYAPERPVFSLDERRFPARVIRGRGGTWWEQIRMPAVAAQDNLDVLFAPAYSAPLFRRLPVVVAIHDLSFAARPEWFAAREGTRRRWLSRRAAHAARAVVTISQFSRRELMERFGVAGPKIHVIPPGINLPAASSAAQDTRGTASSILFAGSIFNRRHVPYLIRAFGPLARRYPALTLEIVGDNRSYPFQDLERTITLEGLAGRVRWRPWVPDDELGKLYGRARAFAFLSEYEGLGLTPLEALAAGVPPLLLDTPVARESCAEAALYVTLDHLDGATRALETLLFDESVRGRLLAAAPGVLARYDWTRAARQTLAVIESAAGQPS